MQRPALTTVLVFSFCIGLPATVACRSEPQLAQTETSPAPVTSQRNAADLLRNGRFTEDGILVGGQPTPEQLEALHDLGYSTVVNLRTPQESGSTDAASVEALGMDYVSLPVAGAQGVNETNARRLAEILETADGPIVVHCASGNRVGALFAMKAFFVDGRSSTEALAAGRAAGLTRLEPDVKQKLDLAGALE